MKDLLALVQLQQSINFATLLYRIQRQIQVTPRRCHISNLSEVGRAKHGDGSQTRYGNNWTKGCLLNLLSKKGHENIWKYKFTKNMGKL